ncbi:unnamed protein product [Parnassius apollo]|uniref:(apollo) hypothetical protein n=1 Tax=Parnassius apollo TaxID=110799 RepID=A0A8S3XK82_PARAO|nr:unnamed protein product [Parnassius apollo]
MHYPNRVRSESVRSENDIIRQGTVNNEALAHRVTDEVTSRRSVIPAAAVDLNESGLQNDSEGEWVRIVRRRGTRTSRFKGTGIRAYEEYIGRGDCGNAQYASRKSTATSPHSPKQAESGCREGSEPNAGDLFGSQPGPLRDGLNFFGAALAVCRIIDAKVSTAGRATGHSSAIPAWRRRIVERIAKARALIGRLICFRSGNNRPRIVRTVRMAFAGTNVSLSQPDITQKLTERIDDLKQRIAAWGKRIRRYTERSTRFNQNRLFQSDQKRLYESLERPMVSGTGPAPNQADTVAFWRGLWLEPVNHSEGPWTEVVASQCAGITPMDPVIITPDDVAEAVRRAPNWKSPGFDGLHHYWLKGFMVCHSVLARQFQEALNQKSLPSLFTTGITHLVPKDQGTTDPSKYRPITCPTSYLVIIIIIKMPLLTK